MSAALVIPSIVTRRVRPSGGVEATRRAVARNRAAAGRRAATPAPSAERPALPRRDINATLGAVMPIDAAVLRGFVRAVESDVAAGILTHDARCRLIARAGRLGIKRFDANLILAAVQNRTIGGTASNAAAPVARVGWLIPLLAAVSIQASIMCGAWFILR